MELASSRFRTKLFPLNMKLRHATILGLVFLLGVAGYVAWCWRPFYLKQTIAFGEDIPPEVVAAVKEWRETDPSWGPEKFRPREALSLLTNPRDGYYDTVTVRRERADNSISVREPSACFGRGYFAVRDGKWKGFDISGNPLVFP